ncbi:Phox (PX) domain-containing protein [Striga asiatica]|uniref:Phox (PX) domain-containing protein n=1 Tax=Striga asiatica TaxID=4170 RepID=A0A5A7PR89_STRAF|nr:Phox (PX) domain-containing protein [Striga asiatica]
MQRQSPPKHRHDGTSPLPLGMDWSPPPRSWAGRETIWPHDPRSGWSYCVTVPSWIVLAKSRDSDPTVFYRVQVGLQSPEGITTIRTVLRRFNDFLKLHAALKRSCPGKNIPPTPPKGLLRMKTRAMLETRRGSLEEWMTTLLSDIDLSRSLVVASFLELEAAARSAFQEDSQPSSVAHTPPSATDPALRVLENSSLPVPAGSTSLASDYGSDTAYETSEIGSPSLTADLARDNSSELGLDDLSFYNDITSQVDKFVKQGMLNIDEGLSMGHSIMEKLENFPRHKLNSTVVHYNAERDMSNGSPSKASRSEPDRVPHHVRKLSSESIGSDRSSDRGSELSNSAFPNSNGLGLIDYRSGPENSRRGPASDFEMLLSDDVQLLVPMDQRQKVNRVFMTLQRRLTTAKTDMEDLISRLNQEIAVKDYLSTKILLSEVLASLISCGTELKLQLPAQSYLVGWVKDLEVELETTKQKSKENLEQAILIEQERVTQMQWDMEELKQRSMELELKLKSEQAHRLDTHSTNSYDQPKDLVSHELISTKQQYEDLFKRHQELELKSKADIKVLVKEVKSLRASHAELTKQLDQSRVEKSKVEEQLQEERAENEQTRTSWREFLNKFKSLHEQLQECHINNLKQTQGDDDILKTVSSFSNPIDTIGTSNDQISLLISKVQHLAQECDDSASTTDTVDELDNKASSLKEELRQLLARILVDNGVLRKQVNSLIVRALKVNQSNDKGENECHLAVDVKSELRSSNHRPNHKRLELLNPLRKKYEPSYSVRSVLDSRTPSSINDNGATEPARILLEKLFAQTQKLEEQIGLDPNSPQAAELGLNLVKLESDLQVALSALKRKDENLQEAERKVLYEIDELNIARRDLERREEEIATARQKQGKLEDELRLANLELASQAAEIGNLKISLKEREKEILDLQSVLLCKEGEIVKMEHELMSMSERAAVFELELVSKSRLVEETNKIVEKQKIELGRLQSEIRKKESELEVSIGLQKSESEKLKAAEAKLKKQATDWLVTQEELRKLTNETSKQGIDANEAVEEFGRVRKLLVDVRSELISSREALALSREKMESQDKLLEKQLSELEEQRMTVMSYLSSLRDAEVEVESERVKLKIAEARNKELKRDLTLEKELAEELKEELDRERCSLERAVQEKSALQEEIERKVAAFEELQRLLEAKESELIEARLEIQHLKSEQCSLQLVLEAKNMELSDAKKRLEEVNKEISELKRVLLDKEDDLIRAMSMLKEKDKHVQTVQTELMDANFKFSEAKLVVEKIVNLTNEIVHDEAYTVLSPLEQEYDEFSTGGFKWQIKRLKAELEFTRESLRAKEMEIVTAQKDLVMKDEELRMVLSELNSREKEITEMKEEIMRENEDLRKLYALAQETIGEKSVGELAIEKLQLEAARLEVEAATNALCKITEMSRELLGKAGSSVEDDCDEDLAEEGGSSNECPEEVKSEVSRLFALTQHLVKEAGIAGNISTQ